MDAFVAELRDQIEATARRLLQAQHAELDFEIHCHSARLLDLINRAGVHGVDTTGWVEPTVRGLAYEHGGA